jgi:hypothetical protein
MTMKWQGVVVLAAAVRLVAACGQTTSTGSGAQYDGPPGNGDDGGSGAATGTSTDTSGGGTVAGGGLDGGLAAGGSSAFGGAGGIGVGDNPFPLQGSGSPVVCDVPSLPTPTTPEGEARAALIDSYCGLLEQYPCLSFFPGEASEYAATCDVQARVAACKLDVTLEYQTTIPSACEAEWQTSVVCATGVDYASTCADPGASLYGLIPIVHLQFPGYDGEPCRPERQALHDCTDQENPWTELTGARATCDYHLAANNPGICEIFCDVNSNYFEAECSGSADGGPFQCTCRLNAHPLLDDGFGYNPRLFGGSCEDAAQRMADGQCIDRVDCCFTWQLGSDGGCACTADPQYVGYATCEEAAAATGGEVVDLCPQYDQFLGGLNIPRSSN